MIAAQLAERWSPAQISRWLRRRWPQRTDWHLCHETIYDAVYRGLVVARANRRCALAAATATAVAGAGLEKVR